MRIVCAPDSFKESMSAAEAADALVRGIHSVDASIECRPVPMADGGEGTTEALVAAMRGRTIDVPCHDALGRPGTGRIGWMPDQSLAVVEVAEGAGLERIAPADRSPWRASSRGVGELLLAALDLGARDFIVGLGGSATNDAGTGMLAALGARFQDATGTPLEDGAGALRHLARVDLTTLDPRLAGVRLRLASDVDNPLLGSHGASAVFGPQKGAGPDDIAPLDAALTRWADVVEPATGASIRDTPGAGAAGGLGAAFLAATPATMHRGVDLIMEVVGLRAAIAGADWVFTGEGSIDRQTARGKTPWGVARAAREEGIPAVLFGGQVTAEGDALVGPDVVAVVPILTAPADLPAALAQGAQNLQRAAASVTRLILVAGRRIGPT